MSLLRALWLAIVALLAVDGAARAEESAAGGWLTFGEGTSAGIYEVLSADGNVVGVVEIVGLTPMRVGVAAGHYQIRRRFGNESEGLVEVDVGPDEERSVRDSAMKKTALPEEAPRPAPTVVVEPPPPPMLLPPPPPPPTALYRPRLTSIPNKIVAAADYERARGQRGGGIALVIGGVATLVPIALFITGAVLVRDQTASEIWFYPLIGQLVAISTGMGAAGAVLWSIGNSGMDHDRPLRGRTPVTTLLARAKARGTRRRNIGAAFLLPGIVMLATGVLVSALEMASVIRLRSYDNTVAVAISADVFLINLGIALTIAGGVNVTSGMNTIRDANHGLYDFDPWSFPGLSPMPPPRPSASVAPFVLKDGAGLAVFGRF